MKKILLLLLLFFSCITKENINYKSLPETHIGKWSGETLDGKKIKIILKSDGFANLIINNKSPIPNINNKETFYIIDYTQNPVELQIVFRSITNESYVYCFIIDFITPSIMKVCSNFNNVKPAKFYENTTFFLKKSF